jgi:hypothetical protein
MRTPSDPLLKINLTSYLCFLSIWLVVAAILHFDWSEFPPNERPIYKAKASGAHSYDRTKQNKTAR